MKKKQESDKGVKNYERILQTVPIILRDTLEALWIKELAPEINTKDEWKMRELTIKL